MELLQQDLLDTRILEEAKGQMQDVVKFDNQVAAQNAVENLESFFQANPTFANAHPREYREYQDMLVLARWVAFSGLTADAAERLFREHLPEALNEQNLAFESKFDSMLLKHPTIEARDELRGRFRRAMLKSEAKFTESGIERGEELISGSVQHWLEDYISETGSGPEPVETLKRTQYFTLNKNFTQLPVEEKRAVRRLIELYEYLKLSSGTPVGFEGRVPVDEGPRPGTIYRGQLEPLDQKLVADYREMIRKFLAVQEQGTVAAAPLEEEQEAPVKKVEAEKRVLTEALKRNQELLGRVRTEEQKLLESASGNSAPLLDAVFGGAGEGIARASAVLALARMGALDEFFGDARAKAMMDDTVLPALAPALSADAGVLKRDFTNKGFSPVYKKELLKYVLMQATEGKEGDAAMIYQSLVNLAGGEHLTRLLRLSFYDMQARGYRFVESAVKNGALENAE